MCLHGIRVFFNPGKANEKISINLQVFVSITTGRAPSLQDLEKHPQKKNLGDRKYGFYLGNSVGESYIFLTHF